jgi:protein O-GlcNAc transferase
MRSFCAKRPIKRWSNGTILVNRDTGLRRLFMSSFSARISQALQAKDLPTAAILLREALTAEPDNPSHAIVAAEIFRKTGDLTSAQAAAERAVAQAPGQPAAWNNRGLVLLDLERPAEAEQQFRQAVSVRPDYARGHFNLGQSLISEDRPAEAIVALQTALRLQPDYPRALAAIGHARRLSGDLSLAIECLRAAHRRLPDHPSTLTNLAGALLESGDRVEAESLLRHAIEVDPKNTSAWHDLGALLESDDRLAEAVECYKQALSVKAREGHSLAALVNARRRLCDWENWTEDTDRLLSLLREALATDLPSPLWPAASLRFPVTPAEQLVIARQHAAKIARQAGASLATRTSPPNAGGRLRIGFLSREFCHSVAGHLAQGLFGRFDRTNFEIWLFDYSPDDGSAVRKRIIGDCDHHISIGPMTDAAAADRIDQSGIHILVEITSYMPHGRPGILAHRPAPIQVSYLYPATLGADYVDYFLTDPIVSPPGDEAYFSEKLIKLPACYLPANREQAIARETPDRAHWGLPENAFVFAAFNAPDKIDPATFDVWMRILKAVPDSVLWQRDADSPVVRDHLRREARKRWVDPERIVFAPGVPRVEDHLARHRHAGMLLDTFVHGAHATAMDALWAGLPVLTCPGETFATRVAASALTAAGLSELIATDPADYERRAIELAENPAKLAAVKARIKKARLGSPIFDTDRLVRCLERAWLEMWARHAAGESPAAFDVSAPTPP